MPTIQFEAAVVQLDPAYGYGPQTVIMLPKNASDKLPSRGMSMIKGTMNGSPFQAVLEPDGEGSHWFKVNSAMREATKVAVGDMISFVVEPSKEWPEPKVPSDLEAALAADVKAHALWEKITPLARWDWIRWVGSTKNPETRQHHLEVACSKLRSGERRPCCFNRAQRSLTEA
jgi:hypothetical protein